MAAKDVRPPPRNLDAARLLGHYRIMLRIRAFEEAALQGLEERLVLGAGYCHPGISRQRNIRDPGRHARPLGPGSRADALGRDDRRDIA